VKIEEKFRQLKRKKEGAYMPHVYYGDPNEEFSLKLIKTLAESGADFIEFGIPFSDPIADGPTFIAACERALKGGVTPAKCIAGLKKLRKEGLETPIVVTTYYNIIYSSGVKAFMTKIKNAGAQAVIVPDLPLEESGELRAAAKRLGLDVIFQVAPTTSDKRLRKILAVASGFLYVINVEGVTGARKSLLDSTVGLIRKIKKRTDIPLMAGFGISR
jgi:tryptophan synthase alpha chain